MASSHRSVVVGAPLLVALLILLLVDVDAIPASYTILHNGQECLYERLEPDEYLTASVFITSGTELKGTVNMDGPVALLPEDADDGNKRPGGGSGSRNAPLDMFEAVEKFEKGHRYGKRIANKRGGAMARLTMQQIEQRHVDYLDFEKMVDDGNIEGFDYDDDMYLDEDDEATRSRFIGDDDKMGTAERKERVLHYEREKRRKRTEMERKMKMAQKGIARNGEPWQKTIQVKVPGWYRVCVKAAWYQITVEMELRKSSELGEPEKGHPHVPTYERRALADAEKLQVDNEAGEDDLKNANEQIRELQRLMAQIRRRQQLERHELSLHSAVNEHSHSRMVLNSLLETVLFMAVTGFQVYSIRKWFDQAPMLGR